MKTVPVALYADYFYGIRDRIRDAPITNLPFLHRATRHPGDKVLSNQNIST